MNENEVHNLLDKTFDNNFDEKQYLNFINEFFNGNFKYRESKILISNSFKEYISEAYNLGEYADSKNKLCVLYIKLKKSSSLDRARTMQRNFVANFINYKNYDACLVAFCDENLIDWRFSFVRIEEKIKLDNGKLKTSSKITPVKRYSYLVGKNEPNHTCKSQLKPFIIENKNPTIENIENAFSVDNVTKEFFNKYKELFIKLKESLDKLKEKDNNIKKEFDLKDIDTVSFSKKLLGQIVFLYFLQKKGWLGVEKDKNGMFKWGSGSKDFLQKQFYKAIKENKNYFNDILEPLFYEALAVDRRENNDYYSKFNCKIPFLNGGLFEPINNYSWEKTDILIENNIFKDIFDTFDRFNFTIKEDEPLDKEVAVDPEMLGRVFENLLEVKDRKSKGAFYTPREIVHYMCQQSLINYLETNLEKNNIPRKDIENFIINGDYTLSELIEEQEENKNKINSIRKKIYPLPESIKQNYKKIDELLTNVKIADPAVGSGAFPVGMMTEIVKARSILTMLFNDKKEQNKRTNYYLKRECIENSLYGVDIEPSAVEITKLRFWLSLIIDEENIQNIKPLPNLDNKIMCGNSLLDEFEGVKLFNKFKKNKSYQTKIIDSKSDILLKKLRKLQNDYFNEPNRNKKKELKKKIEDIEWGFIEEKLKEKNSKEALEKLTTIKKSQSKPFFIWELYFSDVFDRENPGFDIIIGNPPYVSAWNINENEKSIYLNNFISAKGHYDLYVLFIEKSFKLLRKKGCLAFITSNKYMSQAYGENLRKILLSQKIQEIINFDYNVFDTATVETAVLIVIKDFLINNEMNILDIKKPINSLYLEERKKMHQNYFNKIESNNFRINLNDKKIAVLEKIKKDSLRVEEVSYITKGAELHNTKEKIKKGVFIFDKKEKEEFKNYIEGKFFGKYYVRKRLFLDYVPKKHKAPIFPELFESKKLIFKNIIGNLGIQGIYDDKKTYNNDALINLVPYYLLERLNYSQIKNKINSKNISLSKEVSLKFILSLLNSKMMTWYFEELLGFGLHFYPNHLKQLPIKKISPANQKPFIEIVDKILKITKDKDYLENPDKQKKVKELEKEIDQLVYKLYNLTPKEIKIIEEFNDKND